VVRTYRTREELQTRKVQVCDVEDRRARGRSCSRWLVGVEKTLNEVKDAKVKCIVGEQWKNSMNVNGCINV